ncbi:DedA family protein [Rhodothermus profundi]|uniref:Membrane protein DedA, SNARE-associated domain n=1 Tax=Rhodothermus profundi TaxID=633813 RepID=A0A1M6WH58_9BACT|nr:DedA family protein [Rhodothermus profundi]SHK93057.1 membrane protein DedA, SNARE-associated domain [Rhodothermus profundi]
MDWLADLTQWALQVPPLWVYVALLVIAYGENVVPPIPGDLFVVFCGYLAGRSTLELWLVILLSTLGGAAGFMTMYAVGYRIGAAVLDPDRLRWLPKRRIYQVQRWMRRWGYGIVAANRFLSGARSVISLTVGMAHMHPGKTALLATLSAFVWTTLIASLGYAVGENWPVVRQYLQVYGWVVLGVLGLLALGLGIRFWRRRAQKARVS